MAGVTPPGRSSRGFSPARETTVDSTPIGQGPASTIQSILPSRSSLTCCAVVGLGRPDVFAEGKTAASPGMKYKHYAPAARVVILKGSFAQFRQYVDAHKTPDTMALCFAGEEGDLPVPAVAFGEAGDDAAQAARIFAALRELDERGAATVFARLPQTDGVGLAVFNRLVRAAAFQIIDLGGAPCSVTD